VSDRARLTFYPDGRPRRCVYPCQKRDEDGNRIARECSVSVDPRHNGKNWMLTGPHDAPTLSPSIDCQDKPCWHGFIVNGEVRA
jgi:hypothetical protein